MPQCLTPLDVRIRETNTVKQVPCNKCVNCILRKGSEWSFRLMQEEKHCNTAYFITLTYANEHCPITDKRWMALRKRDIQLFFKSLRRNTDYYSLRYRIRSRSRTNYADIRRYSALEAPKPIKYYCVGEYGGRTRRPHYHAIIFNAELELIFKSWNKGDIHVGTVTPMSVGYCMKYMLKKGSVPMHSNDDRPKEFALMSKGIGDCYITDENIRWHLSSYDRLYVNVPGGIKASMPRYYKDRMLPKIWREEAGRRQLERMNSERYHKRVDENGNVWYDYKCEYLEHQKVVLALTSQQRINYLKNKGIML